MAGMAGLSGMSGSLFLSGLASCPMVASRVHGPTLFQSEEIWCLWFECCLWSTVDSTTGPPFHRVEHTVPTTHLSLSLSMSESHVTFRRCMAPCIVAHSTTTASPVPFTPDSRLHRISSIVPAPNSNSDLQDAKLTDFTADNKEASPMAMGNATAHAPHLSLPLFILLQLYSAGGLSGSHRACKLRWSRII